MRNASASIIWLALYSAVLFACHTHAFSLRQQDLRPPPLRRSSIILQVERRRDGGGRTGRSTQVERQPGQRRSPNPFVQFHRTRPHRGGISIITLLRSTGSDDYVDEEEKSREQQDATSVNISVATMKKESSSWNPLVRKAMGGLASIGVLETAYLTFTKLQGQVPFCPSSTTMIETTCSSVLTGPYAQLPGTSIPLAALGLVAYSTTLFLAVSPLLSSKNSSASASYEDHTIVDDWNNRILLTAVTTTMGVFSIFLMSLLFGVLHQSCLYCVTSAVLSILLTKLAWLDLPDADLKRGAQWSLAGGGLSLAVALVLFFSTDPPDAFLADLGHRGAAATRLFASTTSQRWSSDDALGSPPPYSPPAITTTSSPEALRLAKELQALDASFYGAFWCSHCYDQKQILGQQAMNQIPYVECSRDGVNANTALCARKQVPGYPTWEIAGQLYPGEQALEELQEIVARAKAAAVTQ